MLTPKKNLELNSKAFEKFMVAKDHISISSDNTNARIDFTEWFSEKLKERRKVVRKFKSEEKEIPEFLSRTIELGKIIVTPGDFFPDIHEEYVDYLEDSQVKGIKKLVGLLNQEGLYTGINSKNSKNRSLILPPQLIVSDEIVIPIIILTLFKSGHIMLHFSLELNKLSANEFSANQWDLEIDKIEMPTEISKVVEKDQAQTLLDMVNIYIDYFKIKFEADWSVNHIRHLCLAEYGYQPDVFKDKESKNFNESIFRILFAPIYKHQLQSEKRCEELLKEQHYSFSKYYNLYAGYNRMISCFSKKFEEATTEQLKFMGASDEEIKEKSGDIFNTATQALIISVENILIKKSNIEVISIDNKFNMDIPFNQLIDIQILDTNLYLRDYYKNYYTYESVNRLSEFLEDKCKNYLMFNEASIYKEKIESIIKIKKEKLVYNVTLLGSLLTIFLTLLFSYSALESITKGFGIKKHLNDLYIYLNLIFVGILLIIFKDLFKELEYIKEKRSNQLSEYLHNKKPLLLKIASRYSKFKSFISKLF